MQENMYHTLHLWNVYIPSGCPTAKVVRMEELVKWDWPMKGALNDFVSSSCTSGKKGTGVGRGSARLYFALQTQKPIIQSQALETGRRITLQPDARRLSYRTRWWKSS